VGFGRDNTRFRLLQQLPHIILPELRDSQGLVAAGFRPGRKGYGMAAPDLRDCALEAAQFHRVEFVIGKIDGEHRRAVAGDDEPAARPWTTEPEASGTKPIRDSVSPLDIGSLL
jgi:hypothetical protein